MLLDLSKGVEQCYHKLSIFLCLILLLCRSTYNNNNNGSLAEAECYGSE
jgi:hypothetical protein